MSTKNDLLPRSSGGASVSRIANGFRLTIPASQPPIPDSRAYRLAQLDDYAHIPRGKFPHHSLTLSLRARASSASIPGTWGFGVWNDPFGLSLGFGGNPFRLPALPNAAWFFYASEENYLSFKDPRPSSSGFPLRGLRDTSSKNTRATQPSAQGGGANGFMAQVFRSPHFDLRLIPAALAFPFSRKTTRRWLGRVVEEDGVVLWSPTARRRDMQEQAPALHTPALQRVDVTQWRAYRLRWSPTRVVFEVDEAVALETSVSPRGPLGIVIWIDNQYAAFTPDGKIGFGVLENPEPAWLEIEDLKISGYIGGQ